MKKPAWGILCLLALSLSCEKNQQHSPSAASTLSITLNGIDQVTAAKEIRYFGQQHFNDLNPTNTNVWFDRGTVEKVVHLLESESADGIRIYFVSDPNVTTVPSKNSIVLVSTRAYGTLIANGLISAYSRPLQRIQATMGYGYTLQQHWPVLFNREASFCAY